MSKAGSAAPQQSRLSFTHSKPHTSPFDTSIKQPPIPRPRFGTELTTIDLGQKKNPEIRVEGDDLFTSTPPALSLGSSSGEALLSPLSPVLSADSKVKRISGILKPSTSLSDASSESDKKANQRRKTTKTARVLSFGDLSSVMGAVASSSSECEPIVV